MPAGGVEGNRRVRNRLGCPEVTHDDGERSVVSDRLVGSDHELVARGAERFGCQCIVVAIDARRRPGAEPGWDVYVKGGRENTGLDAVAWAQRVVALGAGEILLTSMDGDGTQAGYELNLTRAVADAVAVPVIASGGAGCIDHIAQALDAGPNGGHASAALLASLLHDGVLTVEQIKTDLLERGLMIRPLERPAAAIG